MKTSVTTHALIILASVALASQCFSQPTPLIQAHAHNDYEHKRPFYDALDQGFCSFEADIHLVNGQLLVAHDRIHLAPEKTLQSLYLDPLRARIKEMGGRVYRGGPECTLLIDLKSDWHSLYPVLREVLKQYPDVFSTFQNGAKQTNAVMAIITGTRSKEMFVDEKIRYAAYDGELSDLDSNAPADFIPWISSNWSQSFKWRGNGPMPATEKSRLESIVTKAHAHGRRVRFWNAPDKSEFWGTLLDCKVDIINADDLSGLRKFLTSKRQ